VRHTAAAVVGLVLCLALGWPQISAAQPASRPTIHRVTVRPDSGVLTIAGTGLGSDLLVTVDGQPVTTLPGATDTQIDVQAPASVLTTPGAYRLTVLDQARRVGDGFVVVATQAMVGSTPSVPAHGEVPGHAPTDGIQAATTSAPGRAVAASDPSPLAVVEDSGIPYATALGYQALWRNGHEGWYNAGVGFRALEANTYGYYNTAMGARALEANTSGGGNTALGAFAGLNVTTGRYNVHIGAEVFGSAADSYTMRIGSGQNRTFIAGIHGTQLTGPTYQVVVDANGQLGTLTPAVQLSGGATATPVSVLQQQVQEQRAINAAHQASIAAQQTTIDGLLARLARLEAASRAARRQ
jgi:hypothetical protein